MEQVLRSLVAKLQAHNEEVIENEANYKALESPIQGPDRSRLTLFVESNHCALLVELFRAVLEASVSTKRGRYRQRRGSGCSPAASQEQTHKRGSHGGVLWLPPFDLGRLVVKDI